MKLKQIVIDETDLTLTKEKKRIKYGDVFEVSEERAKEILNATFKGKPVAEIVEEETTKKNQFGNPVGTRSSKTKSKK